MSAAARVIDALEEHRYSSSRIGYCICGLNVRDNMAGHHTDVIDGLPDIAIVDLVDVAPETLIESCKWGTGVIFEKRTDARGGYDIGISLPDLSTNKKKRTVLASWPPKTAHQIGVAFIVAARAAGDPHD